MVVMVVEMMVVVVMLMPKVTLMTTCTLDSLFMCHQVNEASQQAVPVTCSIQPLSDAIAAGAVAMFRCSSQLNRFLLHPFHHPPHLPHGL
jgi:hypothetical protein